MRPKLSNLSRLWNYPSLTVPITALQTKKTFPKVAKLEEMRNFLLLSFQSINLTKWQFWTKIGLKRQIVDLNWVLLISLPILSCIWFRNGKVFLLLMGEFLFRYFLFNPGGLLVSSVTSRPLLSFWCPWLQLWHFQIDSSNGFIECWIRFLAFRNPCSCSEANLFRAMSSLLLTIFLGDSYLIVFSVLWSHFLHLPHSLSLTVYFVTLNESKCEILKKMSENHFSWFFSWKNL